jgi:hypothetical protein
MTYVKWMNDIIKRARRYTYEVKWSEEDQEFVGICLEYPGSSWLEPNRDAAVLGISLLIVEIMIMEFGESKPIREPLNKQERTFKYVSNSKSNALTPIDDIKEESGDSK